MSRELEGKPLYYLEGICSLPISCNNWMIINNEKRDSNPSM